MAKSETNDLVGGRYTPAAVYFVDSDCVEYVKEDTFCVYDRVDEFLTLIYDETKIGLIGFKLKGFKNFFHTTLQPLFDLNDNQFLALASVIEAWFTRVGPKFLQSEDRKRAYKAALKLAANDNVKLYSDELRAAA
jgi:hypothetical protein